MMRIPAVFGIGLLAAVSACSQQTGELRARELFYTPITEVKPKPAEAKPAGSGNEASASTPRRPRPSASSRKPASSNEASEKATAGTVSGARVQNAAAVTEVAGPPLALKYRLLKRSEEGRYDEVDTDSVFQSGDKIRVSVESNDNGYLYIVQQGSSKTWNLLFPNEDTEHGSNRVERNREYEIPGGGRFTFDEQPGVERMFIVLTRRPEPDLEKLIYTLSQSGGDPAKPATIETVGKDSQRLLMASNRIDDEIIGKLRGKVMARDLVFEKVNDEAPVKTSGGTRKEKALYVATQDRTPGARVVVDLNLKHR